MSRRTQLLGSHLETISTSLEALRPRAGAAAQGAIDRVRADASAIRFHLMRADARPGQGPIILAIVGGTGTGKSTLVNRLLGSNLTATSFRRTFTAGPVALVRRAGDLPAGWLGIEHEVIAPADVPARGRADALSIIEIDHELTRNVAFIDTPDLDGDQPAHHAQADRVFRWADAALFLVTPEKYQMTELLPYYRLAARYALPCLFVMNKVEEQAVVDDYEKQVESAERAFAIPRDDSPYQPQGEANLDALRTAVASVAPADEEARRRGIGNRVADLIDRLRDQVLAPLRSDRREADRAIAALRAMEAPPPGVDVNPLTQQLQRRLQQRSVLYLMGPGRMLDRVRQIPGMLARLPRTTWDLLRTGQFSRDGAADLPTFGDGVPDFRAALTDQFTIVQSRVEDVLRSSTTGQAWLSDRAAEFQSVKIDATEAGKIADEELAELRAWLEKHWNATPRDTAVIMRLVKYLPGGEKIAQWSEAAPYLLAIVVATHHAFFGPIDLLVIGGFSLATWLSEKLSNEVASRTRAANTAIARRFTALAHQQIDRACHWLDRQAPTRRALDELERTADAISESVELTGAS